MIERFNKKGNLSDFVIAQGAKYITHATLL